MYILFSYNLFVNQLIRGKDFLRFKHFDNSAKNQNVLKQ